MSAVAKQIKLEHLQESLFINDIYQRPSIWSKNLQSIPGIIDRKKNLWNEISLIHGHPVEYLKKRWKGLKNSFFRQLKKIELTEDRKYAINPVQLNNNFLHYHQMMFLVDPDKVEHVQNEEQSSSKKRKINMNVSVSLKRQKIDANNESGSDSPGFVNQNVGASSSQENSQLYAVEQIQSDSAANSNIMTNDLNNGGHQIYAVNSTTENFGAALDLSKSGNPLNNPSNSSDEEIDPVAVIATPDIPIPQFDGDMHFLMSLYEFINPLPLTQKVDIRARIYADLKQAHDARSSEDS